MRMYMTPISVSDALERIKIEQLHGSEGPNGRTIWKAFGRMDQWEAIEAALNERKGSERLAIVGTMTKRLI